jgi:hypothetical protein
MARHSQNMSIIENNELDKMCNVGELVYFIDQNGRSTCFCLTVMQVILST